MKFKEVLRNYLELKGITQMDLAEMVGDSQQAISDFLSKDSNPRQSTRQKYFDNLDGFLKYYKQNTSIDDDDDDDDDDDNMMRENKEVYQRIRNDHKMISRPKYKGVPYYDVDFTASFLEIANTQQSTPDSYIQHPFFYGCDYVVRASGQSMAKLIKHGDAIGLIKLNNWMDFLPYGEVYAIVTKDGHRLIKIITKGEEDDSYTLISKPTDNKKDEFPNQPIKKDQILSIFKVQASSHLF